MRILGVDPGLKATGYGVIEVSGPTNLKDDVRLGQSGRKVVLVEAGTIEPPQSESLPIRISKIHKNLDDIILQYSPEVMILEKLYAHYKHPVTACVLGHARGVICLLCAQRNIRLIETSVKRIRKTLVGNGNASKEQTKGVVAHILKFNPDKIALDASDALALALGYAHLERYG